MFLLFIDYIDNGGTKNVNIRFIRTKSVNIGTKVSKRHFDKVTYKLGVLKRSFL